MALAVTVEKTPEGRFRAVVPSMPDVSAEGETPEEAREKARSQAAEKLAERADIQKKGDWYFIHSPEIDVSNQGETIEEARQNLKEALELYLSDDE